MIQRLLRGRVLYAALTIFIVSLYARGIPSMHGPAPSEGISAAPQASEPLEWWPSTLDAEAMKRAADRSPHLAVLLSVLSMIAGCLALGGIGLFFWGVGTGRIRSLWRFRPPRLPGWSFGELGRILILIVAIASLIPFARFGLEAVFHLVSDTNLAMTVSMLVLDCFVIVAILAFARGKRRSVWRVFGCTAQKLPGALATGLRGYTAVFPWLFVLLFVAMELARRFGWKPPVEPIQQLIFEEDRTGVLALTVLLACVVGPVAEELLFRGVLYQAIRRRTSRLVAMLASAAAFSLIHTNVVGFLPIFLLGCLLADLYERTGSLAGSTAIHIIHNALLMSVALIMRELLAAA